MTGKHVVGHDVDLAETPGKDTLQRFFSLPARPSSRCRTLLQCCNQDVMVT